MAGFSTVLIDVRFANLISDWPPLLCFLLPLPAALDFTAHELSARYRSNTFCRGVTGWLLGLALGAVYEVFKSGWTLYPFAFLVFLVALEISIAWLFYRAGHLESYLEKYQQGVYRLS